MFYDDPNILYFSIHRFDKGSFYPQNTEADMHFVGTGAGIGKYSLALTIKKH